MKKLFTFRLLHAFCMLLFVGWQVNAQTVNTLSTATWPFNLGTSGQVATFSGTTADYYSQNYVSNGSNLVYKDYKLSTYDPSTYTRFQPTVQSAAASDIDLVRFNLRPLTGLKFTPDSISFKCMRYGTDGGFIDVVWIAPDGTKTPLLTGSKPNRDNNVAGGSLVKINLATSGIVAATGECALGIYIYGLGNTKQAGLSNVIIYGKIDGTVVNVQTHDLTTAVFPAGAGTITSNPVGTKFDQGTEISLTAARNFGFQFKHWANDAQEIVSTSNPYTFTLNANANLTAVFDSVKTYSLNVNVEGGAKLYQVAVSPAPTIKNGLNMYEDGTNVSLTAGSNPILTFNNWATGETNALMNVSMNQNQNLTAVYSAVDFIAGWDFWIAGNNGRSADFYSTSDNQASSLILRNADGAIQGWLDKSQVSGGYEGRPAAVNWKNLTDKYYYQISFNATDFTNISVQSSMLFNYNAYTIQQLEYSTDGTTFTKLDTLIMTSPKAWYSKTVQLPADANHVSKVYFRWIPDYTSAVAGTTSSNDGTTLAGIYVFATKSAYNDGVAPVLSSSVPALNAVNASTSGKVVLTFDENVQISAGTTASLGDKTLSPVISGKTITFAYNGLNYNTNYTFTLGANTVSDLAGNTLTSAVTYSFTTMNRPTVTKKKFDFVLGVDGDFKAALLAAQNASSTGNRFYVFVPNGEYNIGANTGDANQMTTITTPKLSIVGQSADKSILYNKSVLESINATATIKFDALSSNNYLQNISLLNKMDYRTGTLLGRGVALWDQGNKNIYKGVKLLSNQDTYYSGGAIRSYFENSEIHGTVDFICGGGDIFFNECLLYLEDRTGNVITAPATSTNWGYVFNNCTIDGFASNSNSYKLGRPWSNAPKSVFLNTKMNILPAATGWGDPMNVVPAVFAEYNSTTSEGGAVDMSSRRTSYTKDATTVTLNPVLTAQQAATYTVENVVGGDDTWEPKLYTDQAQIPVVSATGKVLSWSNNDYVLCWVIFKDGVYVETVTTNTYTVPGDVNVADYTVCAANEMGGLSPVSNTVVINITGVNDVNVNHKIIDRRYFTVDGKMLKDYTSYQGILIMKSIYENGDVKSSKLLKLQE